ncbi:MAG: cation:proton antiporter [bacterium]|nr:cation:proton antiporter [bacterium]
MLEVIQNLPQSLIFSIGIILIAAAFFAYIAKIFKQPLIPAYIIAGLVLGPIGLKLIQDVELIHSISEIGIIFLLFIVGLEMDLHKLKKLGAVTIITGVFQVLLTFLAGFAVALLLGFDQMNAVYAGLILAFSSTMIVIKLLSDEDELNSLHGRIILGVLFVQDILVIIALTVLLSADSLSLMTLLNTLEKFIALLLMVYIFNRFIIHSLFKFAAKSSELLFLLSVAVCFLFSLVAYFLDFSIAIGAFLGGITLANLPYNLNIIARISSLKDFFATIFFVSLGLQLVFVNISMIIFPLFIFLLLVIILKPLIVMIILSFLGYDKRNAFVSSVALAQISEFGLILALSVDNISPELFSITILLGVISIAFTAYIMKYELGLYTRITSFLALFEKLSKKKKQLGYEYKNHPDIILFGANRVGGTFLKTYHHNKKKMMVIDFNPEIIEKLKQNKIPCMYGDITNIEILRRVNFKSVKVVISTVKREQDNLFLMDYVKDLRSEALIILTAKTVEEAIGLYDAGADYVLVPYVKSGEIISGMLGKYLNNKKDLEKMKQKHLAILRESVRQK